MGGPGPFGGVLGSLVGPKIQKISKNFDGHIKTITPHNLVFGSTPEMTAFGVSRTLWRGPGVTGWAENAEKAKNIKKFDGHNSIDAPQHCFWFDSNNDSFWGVSGPFGGVLG